MKNNSQKERRRLVELVEETNKRLELERKKTEEVSNSFDYMNWIEAYIHNNIKFTTYQYLYDTNNSNNEIDTKINNLPYLFYAIKKYATENYIDATKMPIGESYIIVYNDIKYRIGYGVSKVTYYFCEKVLEETNEPIIDFKNIVYNVPMNNTILINNTFKSLNANIESLIDLGVNIETIQNHVYDAFKESPKTLKRTK